MKEIAPSPGLRVWFGHRPEKFREFGRRYRQELTRNPALGELRRLARGARVTLLYGAHDPHVNHAAVLQSILRGRSIRTAAPAPRVPAKRRRATARS
jgi:uncharacterized protein YeaO (DUF488 family)